MTDLPAGVTREEIIMVDAHGALTDDPARAAHGEITQTLTDGTSRHTLFDVNAPRSRPADV